MGPMSVLEMRSCSQRQNKFTLAAKNFKIGRNFFGADQTWFWLLLMVLAE